MKNENVLLDVFDEICRELRKSGILLSLDGCRAKKNCKIRISFKELEKKSNRS